MKYFITGDSVLKWLETPSVYNIETDELYGLDYEAFEFLKNCSSGRGSTVKNGEFTDYCLKEGILTGRKISVRRPPLIKSPVPSLRYLELQITNRCNLKCKHCYIADKSFTEIPVSRIKKILQEFERLQGLRVLITGGEPLLHGKFEEINRILPMFSVRKVLFTNGTLLNKTLLRKLNIDEIQISIDGLKQSHDLLRGRGAFKRAMDTLKNAIDLNFAVSVSTMIHAENLGDFDEMKKLFKSMGIKEWNVDVPCITGRLKNHIEFQVPPHTAGRYLKYGFGGGIHSGEPGFACGLHLMAVSADGKAAKCSFYFDRPAGLIKEGIKKCRQKIKPVSLNELMCSCDHIESCRGGCRYRAELLGNPEGKDLYKCIYYDIIKKTQKEVIIMKIKKAAKKASITCKCKSSC